MEFKDKFKSIRKSNGYTQGQFAKMLGLTQQGISEIESGKKNPSKTLLAFLKYRYSDIFENESDTDAQPNENKKINEAVIEHQNVIKQFYDPEQGLRINKLLIDIQETSSELFNKVEGYICGVHEAAKTLRPANQNSKKSGKDAGSNDQETWAEGEAKKETNNR
jgi:DNA-binding XRE family transcriptional regulator